MRVATIIITLYALLGYPEHSAGAEMAAGPMCTPVSDHQVAVWFQTDAPASVQAVVFGTDEGRQLVGSHVVETDNDHRCIGTFLIDTVPGRHYHVRLHVGGADTAKPVQFTDAFFVAPLQPESRGLVRIAFGSCAHQDRYPRQPVFRAIADKQPNLFLMLGDNVYLPSDASEYPAKEPEARELYCRYYDRGRRIAVLQPLLRSTLASAIWDDHDFGPENCGASWKWHDLAREIFRLYFPGETGLPDLPGCFRTLRFGEVELFLLDDRTYRTPAHDDRPPTLLGRRQFEWLVDGLKRSKATIKVVACGSQVLADYHFGESWGVDARAERDTLLNVIWRTPITGVIFISGDRHFGELLVKRDPTGRGNDLYDLTSSPLANRNLDWAAFLKSPDRLEMYVGGPNFGLLDIDTGFDPPSIALGVYDVAGHEAFARKVTVVAAKDSQNGVSKP